MLQVRAITHLQEDSESTGQQLREVEENNRVLLHHLKQLEQDITVYRDQAAVAGKEVAELKVVIQKKDEQLEAGEVAITKVASLETEAARLTHELAEQERV